MVNHIQQVLGQTRNLHFKYHVAILTGSVDKTTIYYLVGAKLELFPLLANLAIKTEVWTQGVLNSKTVRWTRGRSLGLGDGAVGYGKGGFRLPEEILDPGTLLLDTENGVLDFWRNLGLGAGGLDSKTKPWTRGKSFGLGTGPWIRRRCCGIWKPGFWARVGSPRLAWKPWTRG